MPKRNPKSELAKFTGVLQAADIDPRCVQQAVGNVPKLVTAYEMQLENRPAEGCANPFAKQCCGRWPIWRAQPAMLTTAVQAGPMPAS